MAGRDRRRMLEGPSMKQIAVEPDGQQPQPSHGLGFPSNRGGSFIVDGAAGGWQGFGSCR